MFRTLLVLLFLVACGFYFHQKGSNPAPSQTLVSGKAENTILDDSSLQDLKKFLPAQLFEKEVRPAIEQNKCEGLSSDQLSQLINRLHDMSRELGGKASEAVSRTVKNLEETLPHEKSISEKSAGAAGKLARKASEDLKESLPAFKEISEGILSGMVTILSQLLTAATELLKK